MAAHAKLGPSGASGWMACPGWQSNSESSEYAREGTAAHELAATCLEAECDADKYLGVEITVEGQLFEVDEDMVRHVQTYLDLVRSLDGQLFVETAVPIDHITLEANAKGTADAVLIGATELTIIDLKYGMGVKVDAEHNPQLMLYLLGAVAEFGYMGPFETFRAIISQPRLGHVSECVFTFAELRQFSIKARDAAMLHGDPQAELNPGEKQCRWCVKQSTCEAAANMALSAVADDFIDLTKPIEPQLEASIQRIESADLAHLGACLAAAPFIEQWIKAVRARVEREMFAGNTVPGYKLVEGKKGARKWTDEDQARALLARAGLPEDKFAPRSLISPTQAEKLLKGSEAWEQFTTVVTQSEGSPSVAPESDKRPALAQTAVPFQAL